MPCQSSQDKGANTDYLPIQTHNQSTGQFSMHVPCILYNFTLKQEKGGKSTHVYVLMGLRGAGHYNNAVQSIK